jgi:acetyl-CoA carboxylase carboxyltransferase component
MGPEGAVSIIYRKELAESKEPEKRKADLATDYRDRFSSPYVAAGRGYVDDVIEPHQTRPVLIKALNRLGSKRDSLPLKKHGNMPL